MKRIKEKLKDIKYFVFSYIIKDKFVLDTHKWLKQGLSIDLFPLLLFMVLFAYKAIINRNLIYLVLFTLTVFVTWCIIHWKAGHWKHKQRIVEGSLSRSKRMNIPIKEEVKK